MYRDHSISKSSTRRRASLVCVKGCHTTYIFEEVSNRMNQLLELVPGIAFFVVYFLPESIAPFLTSDNRIYWATIALMVAVGVQFILFLILKRPITKMMWFILMVAGVLGTMTVALRNPLFIMWRPTVTSWLMSTVFLFSYYVGKTNVLKWLLGDQVRLPDQLWRQQTLVLGYGLLASGTVNIFVAYSFSEQTWVTYKVYALFVWPVLFAAALLIINRLEHRKNRTQRTL